MRLVFDEYGFGHTIFSLSTICLPPVYMAICLFPIAVCQVFNILMSIPMLTS